MKIACPLLVACCFGLAPRIKAAELQLHPDDAATLHTIAFRPTSRS